MIALKTLIFTVLVHLRWGRLGCPSGRVKDGFAEDGVAANSLASYTQGKVGVTGEQQPVTRE